MRKLLMATAVAGVLVGFASAAMAEDYLTMGADPGRTGLIKGETILTKANAGQVKLLWKTQLPSEPRAMHNLFSPLIAQSVATSAGNKEVAIVAGVSDDMWGLDAKTGAVMWHDHFQYTAAGGETITAPRTGPSPLDGGALGSTLCPGGQVAAPVMENLGGGKYRVWALSWDGSLHQLNPADGSDLAAPVKFTGGNGKPYALNLFNGVIYTGTSQSCGGVPNQMDFFDIKTQKAAVFYPAGGGLWGRRGVGVDPQGRGYLGTGDGHYDPTANQLGNSVVAGKPDGQGGVQIAGWYAPINANYAWKHDLDINVTPMVIDYNGGRFVAHSSKECTLYVADRDNLGGADHRHPVADPLHICNDRELWDEHGVWGSLSSYEDSAGKEWIYVPFWGPKSAYFNPPIVNTPAVPSDSIMDGPAPGEQDSNTGGVAAVTLDKVGGKWTLTPRWISQNMPMGEEGLIANDVFWVYAAGQNARQQGREIAWNDTTTPWGNEAQLSGHTVVYALDAHTGKTLWSSGDQIKSFNHFSDISLANGKVYVGTYDGMLYCFGIAS